MIILDFPEPYFKTRQEGDRPSIFDVIRQRWVALTPEEWVRQNIIQWLLLRKGIPKAALSVEKEIRLGSLNKRFDLIVFDRNTRPWMMVECKAENVQLNESVLMQILSYNLAMPAEYLLITNGQQCHVAKINDGESIWMSSFPSYP